MVEGCLLETLTIVCRRVVRDQFAVVGKDFHGWLAYKIENILFIKGCL